MKKTITKLQLSSETVRTLSGASLGRARGGILKSAHCSETDYRCPPASFDTDCGDTISYGPCNKQSFIDCSASAWCQVP